MNSVFSAAHTAMKGDDAMTKLLDKAIRRVRSLPSKQQDDAASLLLALVGGAQEPYRLSDDERVAVQAGIDEADRDEFVSDEDMEAFWNRHKS